MKRREFLTVDARAAAGTMLLGSTPIVLLAIAGPAATLAQHGMPGGTPMTFFVTSEPIGNNLHKRSGLTEKGQIVPGLNDHKHPQDDVWEYVRTIPYTNRHAWLQPDRPGHDAWRRDVLLLRGRLTGP